MTKLKNCPVCGVSFVGKEIPYGLFSTGHYKTMKEAKKAAESYGWTPENKKYFSDNITLVKSINRSVQSYFRCEECKHQMSEREYDI